MTYSYTAKAGQTVLLVARASGDTSNLDALQKLRDSLVAQVGSSGKVDFEQVDRIEEGAATLTSAQYDVAIANPVIPHTVEHSSNVLGQILLALKPSGTLVLYELVLDTASSIEGLSITRTQEDLEQQLQFAGFIDTRTEVQPVPEAGLLEISATKNFVASATGRVLMATASAAKPTYNVGAAAALSFGKKAKAKEVGGSSAIAPKKAWMLNVDSDDEAEIEDQDGLLEEEDLAKPDAASLARPDGAVPKRKACKNCTCGLAEGKMVDDSEACKPTDKPKRLTKPVDVVNVKSACGNCSLGDAFRCSSCPYLGQPFFKPGEKVVLGGSMLFDDFMP
ncbi:electron carrier [Coemansia furcata]|uniref:Electron carrier n=1 Tax=Coemansia furcata TaxID=417177 RepID=A0ACC1L6G4_9FUNG|nr:electron carrier [Coemansia furcata]